MYINNENSYKLSQPVERLQIHLHISYKQQSSEALD